MAIIQDAIEALQKTVSRVAGIKQAPEYPPENINDFPFAICYARDGSWDWDSFGSVRCVANVVLEVHVARKDLPYDIERAMVFSDSVPEAILADDTLSNCGYELRDELTWTFGPMRWGAQTENTVGFRWVIAVEKSTTV